MRIPLRVSLPVLLALVVAGCGDYLSAPDATADPTKVTEITRPGPLYVGIQQSGPAQREGGMLGGGIALNIALNAVMYTQQIAGLDFGAEAIDRYQTKPSDMDGPFAAVYGGGGLLDIRKMQKIARVAHDSLYIGIGKVYEALVIGYAADVWGDIPYREAADSDSTLHPKFDPQLQVYRDIQAQLDSAITLYLASAGPSTLGQDNAELIYRGRESELPRLYTEVAHSLKARYFVHVALTDPTAYRKAFDEARLGIGTPADDFLWFHNTTPNSQNLWWSANLSESGVAPGAAMIQILLRRINAGIEDSSRLKFYFTPGADGGYFGYRPTGDTLLPNGGGSPAGNFSGFGPFIDVDSSAGDFRQPELTYAEMQLIMAEAQWHLNCPGCTPSTVVAQAQPFLDAARQNRRYGATGGAPVTFPSLGSAPASLQNIMEEKYVALFLNPEVWNDYKRTCLPSLAPAPPSTNSTTPGSTPIPGRLPYSQQEMNANPNTPKKSSGSLNPNQPTACRVLNYTSSSPLAN